MENMDFIRVIICFVSLIYYSVKKSVLGFVAVLYVGLASLITSTATSFLLLVSGFLRNDKSDLALWMFYFLSFLGVEMFFKPFSKFVYYISNTTDTEKF